MAEPYLATLETDTPRRLVRRGVFSFEAEDWLLEIDAARGNRKSIASSQSHFISYAFLGMFCASYSWCEYVFHVFPRAGDHRRRSGVLFLHGRRRRAELPARVPRLKSVKFCLAREKTFRQAKPDLLNLQIGSINVRFA